MNDRRQFLQNSVALAGVCASAANLAPQTARCERSFARIALGWIGETCDSSLIKSFAGRRSIAAASSNDEKLLARLPGCKRFSSPDAVLRDPAIHAVIVVGLTPEERGHWGDRALRAGKHIYVETPLCGRLTSAPAMVAHAHLPCRTRAGLRQAMDALWAGKIGWVESAHVVSYRSEAATPHAIDLARWGLALEREPSTIQKSGTQVRMTWSDRCLVVEEVIGKNSPIDGLREGVIFRGPKGKLICTLQDSAVAYAANGEMSRVFKGSGDPAAELFRSIRGKPSNGASCQDAIRSSILLKLARGT